MTTIAGPRALPRKGTPTPEAIFTTAEVVELVKRSNHATAFAGWTVTTIVMGLVLQTRALRSIASFPITLVLIGLLVPILAATVRTGMLLARAGRAVSVVGGEDRPTGAAAGNTGTPAERETATRQAQDCLWAAITSAQVRDALAHRALMWSYAAGGAFVGWSLAVMVLARTGGV